MSSLKIIKLGEHFSFKGDGTADVLKFVVLPETTSGYWYAFNGNAYLITKIPNLKADIYVSDVNLIKI